MEKLGKILGYTAIGLGIVLVLMWANTTPSTNYASDTADTSTTENLPRSYVSDTPSAESAPITSSNWDCTSDCSGHEAGYNWASDNGICDTEYTDGNSDSFNEGVQAYANENCEEEPEDDGDYYDYRYN